MKIITLQITPTAFLIGSIAQVVPVATLAAKPLATPSLPVAKKPVTESATPPGDAPEEKLPCGDPAYYCKSNGVQASIDMAKQIGATIDAQAHLKDINSTPAQVLAALKKPMVDLKALNTEYNKVYWKIRKRQHDTKVREFLDEHKVIFQNLSNYVNVFGKGADMDTCLNITKAKEGKEDFAKLLSDGKVPLRLRAAEYRSEYVHAASFGDFDELRKTTEAWSDSPSDWLLCSR